MKFEIARNFRDIQAENMHTAHSVNTYVHRPSPEKKELLLSSLFPFSCSVDGKPFFSLFLLRPLRIEREGRLFVTFNSGPAPLLLSPPLQHTQPFPGQKKEGKDFLLCAPPPPSVQAAVMVYIHTYAHNA